MDKRNCWEFMNCGREEGDSSSAELGICPASRERRLDGIHHGLNAGRSCWVLAGTLCKGRIEGTFASKFSNCKDCNFYRAVKEEEFPHFRLSPTLLKMVSD